MVANTYLLHKKINVIEDCKAKYAEFKEKTKNLHKFDTKFK